VYFEKASPSKIKKKNLAKSKPSFNNTTQSLTVIALHKPKKNFWRFQFCVYRDLSLGFYLCLCSRSDNSENANQMHLSIHSKPPGFNVNMLSIPLEERQEKTLSNYFRLQKIVLLRLLLKVIP
jgi:hypothetical protein